MNASCSASFTDEAAVVYSINLGSGDQQKTNAAIAAALGGNWTQLAALPNASPLRNVVQDTDQFQHKIVINLLGIYNAETVDTFVKSCTVLHNPDGQVVVTDKGTATHISVASAPLLADTGKLRSALSEASIATISYVAGGAGAAPGIKMKDLSMTQTYLRFGDKMSRRDMLQQIALGEALKLIAGKTGDSILASRPVFNHAKITASASYDSNAAMKLFFSDASRRSPRSRADLTRMGRQVMLCFVDPSDPSGPARIRVLKDDALWTAMDNTDAVAEFGTIPGLSKLGANELADVGADWSDVTWWAGAMSKVAPKLRDMLAALEQSTTKDPTADQNFMKKRDKLASVLGKVAQNARAAFAGGWGIAVMEAVSGFAAPVTLDISADGNIKQHYASPQAIPPSR